MSKPQQRYPSLLSFEGSLLQPLLIHAEDLSKINAQTQQLRRQLGIRPHDMQAFLLPLNMHQRQLAKTIRSILWMIQDGLREDPSGDAMDETAFRQVMTHDPYEIRTRSLHKKELLYNMYVCLHEKAKAKTHRSLKSSRGSAQIQK